MSQQPSEKLCRNRCNWTIYILPHASKISTVRSTIGPKDQEVPQFRDIIAADPCQWKLEWSERSHPNCRFMLCSVSHSVANSTDRSLEFEDPSNVTIAAKWDIWPAIALKIKRPMPRQYEVLPLGQKVKVV